MKTQKTKKSFKKKALLSSLSMLMVATVAVGSATFAWFTSNKSVTANNMVVKAAAAKGLQITGTNSDNEAYWGPTYSFEHTDVITLSPVSVDYSTTEKTEGATPQFDQKLGTPYYPNSVSKTGAWTASTTTADIDNWQIAKYPEKVIAGQNDTDNAVASNGYFAAYQVGLRSTGDDISNVKVNVKYADTNTTPKAGANQYMRIAVLQRTGGAGAAFDVDGDNLIAVYGSETSPNAISKISPVATDAQLLKPSNTTLDLTGVTITSVPKYYIVLVWFEGQDGECVDSKQTAEGKIDITFSYTEQ